MGKVTARFETDFLQWWITECLITSWCQFVLWRSTGHNLSSHPFLLEREASFAFDLCISRISLQLHNMPTIGLHKSYICLYVQSLGSLIEWHLGFPYLSIQCYVLYRKIYGTSLILSIMWDICNKENILIYSIFDKSDVW